MAPRDFENLERLKLVIPAFELFTIVGTFVGPLVAPTLWLRFVALFIAVFVLASACQVRRMAAFVLKLRRTLRRYEGTEGVMSMEGGGVEGGEKALFGEGGDSAQSKKPKVSSSSSSAKIVEDEDDVGASDSTPLRLGVVGGESDSAPAAARSANPASTSTSSNSADAVAVDVGGFVHAFVIPNYQEPLHVLRSTLARLAAHRGASARYLVTLAMEEGERGAAAKAAELVAEFGSGTCSTSSSSSSSSSFLDLSWSLHPRGIPGESPGKASNANHGARAAVKRAAALGFPAARVMVTCMDADAHVPPLYVALVDAAAAAADDPHARVYAAPIVFERNATAVPALTRVHDAMWSAMAAQNLGSSMGLGFPISNYSMSASLLRAVDFWDLHDDAIGEDLHMFLKAYFKTGGEKRVFFFFAGEFWRERREEFLNDSFFYSTSLFLPQPHPPTFRQGPPLRHRRAAQHAQPAGRRLRGDALGAGRPGRAPRARRRRLLLRGKPVPFGPLRGHEAAAAPHGGAAAQARRGAGPSRHSALLHGDRRSLGDDFVENRSHRAAVGAGARGVQARWLPGSRGRARLRLHGSAERGDARGRQAGALRPPRARPGRREPRAASFGVSRARRRHVAVHGLPEPARRGDVRARGAFEGEVQAVRVRRRGEAGGDVAERRGQQREQQRVWEQLGARELVCRRRCFSAAASALERAALFAFFIASEAAGPAAAGPRRQGGETSRLCPSRGALGRRRKEVGRRARRWRAGGRGDGRLREEKKKVFLFIILSLFVPTTTE